MKTFIVTFAMLQFLHILKTKISQWLPNYPKMCKRIMKLENCNFWSTPNIWSITNHLLNFLITRLQHEINFPKCMIRMPKQSYVIVETYWPSIFSLGVFPPYLGPMTPKPHFRHLGYSSPLSFQMLKSCAMLDNVFLSHPYWFQAR